MNPVSGLHTRIIRKFRAEGAGGVVRAVGRRIRGSKPSPPPLTASNRPRWEDLIVEPGNEILPGVDRRDTDPAELTPDQRHYRKNGYLIVSGLIPDELIDRYCKVREQLDLPGGYPYNTPYIDVPEIKDLCLYPPLARKLEELLDEPMGVHLNLTGWVSTERNWHQDAYLNPGEIGGYYCAVWFALEDIHPDSGPFEFVPGSHDWGHLSRERVLSFIPAELHNDPSWPKYSELFLTDVFEDQVRRRGLASKKFLARRGDVLIWHTSLMHRGSTPIDRGRQRRALIAHFSSIRRRFDMPLFEQHQPERGGGYYFVFPPTGGSLQIPERDRAQMADLYIRGRGLELGALHAPNPVPPGALVEYVDRLTLEDLTERFPELQGQRLVEPTVIEDGFRLTSVADESQDFVIANHVLEHASDAVQAILTWSRVLRRGGVLLIAVPIVDECFDHGRETTSLEHFTEDYRLVREGRFEEFKERNRAHYVEWVNISEVAQGNPSASPEQAAARVNAMCDEGFEIHFHTFTAGSFRALLQHVGSDLGGPALLDLARNRGELIAALRKG